MISRRAWLGLAGGLLGCGPRRETVTVRGSDSEVTFVQRVAERFLEVRPDVAVGVTGGGSGVGITSLIEGTADVASSSRDLEPAEVLLAYRRGRSLRWVVFALDAVAVVVHASSPLRSASLDEVGRLFRGEDARFADGRPVVRYGRAGSSGTRAYFRRLVVRGAEASDVRELPGNAHIVQAVAEDPGGIGYVAAGYLAEAAGVRALALSAGGEAVSPLDEEAIEAGRYPLLRPLFQFFAAPLRDAAREFLAFELSEEGARIARDVGLHPPSLRQRESNGRSLEGA